MTTENLDDTDAMMVGNGPLEESDWSPPRWLCIALLLIIPYAIPIAILWTIGCKLFGKRWLSEEERLAQESDESDH